MNAIVVGPDRGIAAALETQGVDVTRIEGVASGEKLTDAGVEDAGLLVVTDAGEATAVPVAIELNADLKTVAYTPDSMPEFVKAMLDFAIDPAALSADAVAEELV
jgi:hypothetical protein